MELLFVLLLLLLDRAPILTPTHLPCAVRVENEQIGNFDQYRVTRELPLPYDLNGMHEDPESSEGEDEQPGSPSASMRLRAAVGKNSSRRSVASSLRERTIGQEERDRGNGPY